MSKPRDICGNDLIVPCTALAVQIARSAGLADDNELVKKLRKYVLNETLRQLT